MGNLAYFSIYLDNSPAIMSLTDAEAGALFKALCSYSTENKIAEFPGAMNALFSMFRAQIDRAKVNYEDQCASRSKSGKKGAEARWGADGKNSKCHSENGKNSKCHFSDGKNGKDKTRQDNTRQEKDNRKTIQENDTEVICTALSPICAEQAPISLILNTGNYFPVTQDLIDKYSGLFPAVDVMQELRNMAAWLDSHPKHRKTQSGIKAFISNWLTKAQNQARSSVVPADRPNPKDGVARIIDMMGRGVFDG